MKPGHQKKRDTAEDEALRTRVTLLSKLRDGSDEQAWARFYGTYKNVVMAMARGWGLSEHSAEDVLQDVMMAVSRSSHLFVYDAEQRRFTTGGFPAKDGATQGGFRQWFFTVVKRAIWKRAYPAYKKHEINASDLVTHGDEQSWQKFYEQEPATGERPDDQVDAKSQKTYQVALLEQAIRLLPRCTRRSHPRKLAIFLALKQPHVFDSILRLPIPPLPPAHMAECRALARIKVERGGTITKQEIIQHYAMTGDHVDHEVAAIKKVLITIFVDLRSGHEPCRD